MRGTRFVVCTFSFFLFSGWELAQRRPPVGRRRGPVVGHGCRAGGRHPAPGGAGVHQARRRKAN